MSNKFFVLSQYTPKYYKSVKKNSTKHIINNKLNYDESSVLPANGHDICNYIAKYGIANYQIQVVMKLDGRLDFEKLLRAVRLSIDVEPVLGCRFIENDPPYWKKLDNIDTINFCSFEMTNNPDKSIRHFLKSSLRMDKDPMVKVKLIRTDHYDTLCIKLNHACTDGAGTKEYILLLSDIYSRIVHDGDNLVLKQNIRNKDDHNKLFSALNISDPTAPELPSLKAVPPMWQFPWKNKQKNTVSIALCRLPEGKLEEISKYCKLKNATINDLILTAFYRAMFKMSKPPYGVPMHILVTVDLRRFLPEKKADAIRNFSGGVDIKLARKYKEPFDATLARVVKKMNRLKIKNPGIENAIAAERIEKIEFHKLRSYFKSTSKIFRIISLNPFVYIDKCAPVLSNLGVLSKQLIKFGDTTVTDAYVTAPAINPPGLLLVASTYNGILTLTVCYYKDSVRCNYIEKLLNKIRDELIKGCSQ